MESIADVALFCKAQAEFHIRKSEWKGPKPSAAQSHKALADQFLAAAAIIEREVAAHGARKESSKPEDGDLFTVDPFDLDGLPEDLISELSISKADQEDAQLIQLFRIARRPLNINEVMVGLFRKFGVQSKRSAISARLYRISSRGDLANVDKGVYVLPEVVVRSMEQSMQSAGG